MDDPFADINLGSGEHRRHKASKNDIDNDNDNYNNDDDDDNDHDNDDDNENDDDDDDVTIMIMIMIIIQHKSNILWLQNELHAVWEVFTLYKQNSEFLVTSSGFITGQALGKLPGWFDHLAKSFLAQKFSSIQLPACEKRFALLFKTLKTPLHKLFLNNLNDKICLLTYT